MADFLDLAMREQTLFEIYKSPALTETEEALRLALDKINRELIKLGKNKEMDRRRLKQLFALIAAEINPVYKKLKENLPKEAGEIAATIYTAVTFLEIPKQTLQEIMSGSRLIQGYTFNDLIQATNDNHIRQIKRVIGAGVAKGERFDKIIQDVEFKNTRLTEHQLRTVVYTYISESRAAARYAGYKKVEEKGVIKYYVYVATLDSRTTEYCRNHDGRKYYKPIDEIKGEINTHFNCRSVFKPVLVEGRTSKKRASVFGQVRGDITYREWFAMQNEDFQKKVLGRKKFEAYKRGKYKIGGLPDVKGKDISLKEIKKFL